MNSTACTREPNPDAVGRHEIAGADNEGPVVSRSKGMRRALDKANQVARTNATVLLLGETGVGKEVLAQAIHYASPRRSQPMVRVNCAAIPTTLIESEMFGHERGAFTGALSRQLGRFELADGSTLFLDEIGDMPLEVQVKLLRVLEERTIERLGSSRSFKIDVRIIAATNRDLQQAVNDGSFRRDLYYRLNVFPIRIPPLRERRSDIPALAWKFVDDLSPRIGRRIESISRESLRELERYSWPGNIRELRNVIERAMIVAKGPVLTPLVPSPRGLHPAKPPTS
jgi:formate hydrogenlyase transcriptional activator